MKCRTCLRELDLNSRLSLTTNLPIGKTIEEIILLFIPELVKTKLADNFICPQCMENVQTFLKFIEKCISVENYLKQQEDILEEIKNVDSVNISPVTTSPLPTISIEDNDKSNSSTDNLINTAKGVKLILQEGPFNVLSKIKRIKTYSRRKRNSISENEGHVVDIPTEASGGYKTVEISEKEIVIDFDNNSSRGELLDVSITDEETLSNELIRQKSSNTTEVSTKIPENGTEFLNIKDRTLHTDFVGSSSKMMYPAFSSPVNNSGFKNHRAVSVRAETETISHLLKKFPPHKIKVMKQQMSEKSGPKRLILLGTVLVRCPDCGRRFTTEPAMRWHFKKVHPERRFPRNGEARPEWKCPECKLQLNTEKLFRKHMKRVHKQHETYRCENCNVVYKNIAAYNDHVENYKLYKDCRTRKCFICKEIVSKHLYNKHADSHKNKECPTCKKKFSSDGRLNLHLSRHKNDNGDCRTRQKKTQRRLCPICGVLMNDQSALRIHIARHSEIRLHLCSKCPKSFKTRGCLNKHMKIVHEKGFYECSLCHIKTKSTWGLRNHMRLKHSTAYTHVCHVCGKSFVRSDYLRRHIRMHKEEPNGRKKYLYPNDSSLCCKYCNKSFMTVGQLREHIRRIHMKNFVRYRCQYCNMTFSFLSNKIRHEKRHKDQKVFDLTCTVCWNKFDCKEMLDEHYMRHSGSPRYTCDLCGEMLPTKFLLSNHKTAQHSDEPVGDLVKTDLTIDGFVDFVTLE